VGDAIGDNESNEGGNEDEEANRPAAASAEDACAQKDDDDIDDDDDDGDDGDGASAAMSSADIISPRASGGRVSNNAMQSSRVLRASPLSHELLAHCRTTWREIECGKVVLIEVRDMM
jgi:hypothetical protein